MKKFIQLQRENMFLWVPFLLSAGAVLFFASGINPNQVLFIGGLIAVACVLYFGRHNIFIRAITSIAFGFIYAGIFTVILNTPTINRDIRDRTFTADVIGIDYTSDKTRLMLRTTSDQISATGHTKALVRMSIRDIPIPKIGDTVRVTGNLYPGGAPYVPGGFDYARWSYFNNLTATGYITDIDVIAGSDNNRIDAMRDKLHTVANSFLVDALVLGYKNAIDENAKQIWTDAGVGHIWSISGFHMTLLAGWLFAILWFIFRRIPYITRRITARSVALITSWFGLLFYLFLSGIDVATIRAFIMTTLGFMAFVFGRNALSMRNVCLAFCFIFLINPHYVMQAGFQLSFAAIFGLVWFWNVRNPKMPENKILKIICVATLTSIVASVFTAPFVIAHFGAIPIYSLVGNLVLIPIFSFAIMPLVFIGVIATPMGYNSPVHLAHTIYDYAFNIAERIAALPNASVPTPPAPSIAMAVIIFGFCCLMFIRGVRVWINYAICGACMCVGILIITYAPRPIFMATHDHELVAFVRDGNITFNKSRASNHYFAFDTWKAAIGTDINTPNKRAKHDHGVYRFYTDKFNLVYIQKFSALMPNIVNICADENIDYIVTYFDVNAPHCNHKILRGPFVIYPNGRVHKIKLNPRWHSAYIK